MASGFRFPRSTSFRVSLVATGFPTHQRKNSANMELLLGIHAALARRAARRRRRRSIFAPWRAGASTRSGNFGLKSWDSAAGMLLVEEAGGMVTDLERRAVSSLGGPHDAGHERARARARCRKWLRASPNARRASADRASPPPMNVSEFDYELPAAQIAQRPLAERDASRCCSLRSRQRRVGRSKLSRISRFAARRRADRREQRAGAAGAAFWPASGNLRAQPGGHESGARRIPARRRSKCCWCGRPSRAPGKRWCGRGARCRSASASFLAMASSRRTSKGAANSACACCDSRAKRTLTDAVARLGHIPLPPYIKREDERARSRAVSNGVRARGQRRCGAHGGIAFHAGDSGAAAGARNRNCGDHPRCRTGHV